VSWRLSVGAKAKPWTESCEDYSAWECGPLCCNAVSAVSTAKRNISAQCPSCGLHELVATELNQQPEGHWVQMKPTSASLEIRPSTEGVEVKIDTCPFCFGAWFDAGELDTLAGETNGIERALDPATGPSRRVCPRGHGTLAEHTLPGLIATRIDRCSMCGGIWLDGHERRRLARASTREGQGSQAEQWLRRGAIWAAQVLTQLPVEVDNPARGYPLVVVLILTTLFVVFVGQQNAFIWTDYYGLIPGRLWHEHDIHSVVTYMFLHGTWYHLLTNAYFLFIFGDNVEYLFGRFRFALFFMLSGMLAGTMHALLLRKTAGVMVGASGAISAVLAAYVCAFPRQRLFQVILWIQLKIPAWIYVIGWFAIQIAIGLATSGGDIAWAAHVGGFLVGLAITPWILARKRREVAARVAVPALA